MQKRRIDSSIFLAIFNDLNIEISSQSRILDFGCGNGNTVKELLDLGYNAKGCDFKFKDGEHVAFLSKQGYIKLISDNPYKLPYPDNTFDILISNQVMEHVKNYGETLAEIYRVLKPNGVCCHIFPSKYKIIESHVYVPFSSIIRNQYYLLLWAFLGIRKSTQKGKKPQEIARENQAYLLSNTNYLSISQVIKEFNSLFKNIYFVEKYYLKNSPSQRGRILYKWGEKIPLIFLLYRFFMSYIIIASDEKILS
ncbi:class I SAM-dependent methyltransferase [Cyanobacterium aponinum]|uniref:Methyltransferase type 11 n=1 Tax=Cyanobacterium aponinum (strain PCC 10605) TaxID=755178 RepID=K9Z249_CYAAP|nr:class I SAM-dependent methyltransferase [Cyanobacterium aponinum]AFZ53204.1 Methyltransferase type 11 [Cyanobacterium aponinum PCC 10605]